MPRVEDLLASFTVNVPMVVTTDSATANSMCKVTFGLELCSIWLISLSDRPSKKCPLTATRRSPSCMTTNRCAALLGSTWLMVGGSERTSEGKVGAARVKP
ncbi:hypothetical protein NP493_26g04016 [Ridgeia piscesae]|uniref:Uncharacterized protein n=1 Tax=Ridgeia piscesae TaxID=27915 RepID=A0AAD9UKE2_RIDPI|nr:hypothetical protein NP493_26g04016 [Ridgeia piscesae]